MRKMLLNTFFFSLVSNIFINFLFRQGGQQAVNLEIPGCLTKDTVFHEVFHALGKGGMLTYFSLFHVSILSS